MYASICLSVYASFSLSIFARATEDREVVGQTLPDTDMTHELAYLDGGYASLSAPNVGMMFPPGSATVPDRLQHFIYICKGQLDLFGYYWGLSATKKKRNQKKPTKEPSVHGRERRKVGLEKTVFSNQRRPGNSRILSGSPVKGLVRLLYVTVYYCVCMGYVFSLCVCVWP